MGRLPLEAFISVTRQPFEHLVQAVQRAREAERFAADVHALELATQSWAIGHGLVSLVAGGLLPRETLAFATPMLVALFVLAGDDPDRCRSSVRDGWDDAVPSAFHGPA